MIKNNNHLILSLSLMVGYGYGGLLIQANTVPHSRQFCLSVSVSVRRTYSLTNRRELIDPALLRPGRLEVQMYVGLPDAEARHEILGVHLSRLVENDIVTKEVVDLYESRAMAEATEGLSGAEIAGLVRSAMSVAIVRATVTI